MQGAVPVVNAMFVSKISCPPVLNLIAIIKKGFMSCKLVNNFLDIDDSLDFSNVYFLTLPMVLTLQLN